MRSVDTHCHLQMTQFDADREEVLARALEQLAFIIVIGDAVDGCLGALELVRPNVYATVGFHPYHAVQYDKDAENRLEEFASRPGVVAIGEIGLDYHYDLSPRTVQQEVFLRQLDIARQTGKPFVVHEREAHADTFEIIRSAAKGLEGVFHCFSGSVETARQYLKLGFYISIAGPVTFPKSAKTKEVARYVPLDRLLIETDSPYLTPQAYRGRRNEPAHVRLVAEEIASLRDLSLTELARATSENACRLFRIPAV